MSLSTLSVSVLALSVAFAWTPSAQDQSLPYQKPEFRGGTGGRPINLIVRATYDVQLERLTSVHRSPVGQLGIGNPLCFDNSEIVLPVDPGYIVGNVGEDMLAWGTKNCTGASLLRKFTMAYRSEAIDLLSGGPGAVFSIALYSGTRGFGRPGTEIYRHTFTGMPTNGIGPGGELVLLTVDFGTEPLPLNDGNFGWSFLQLDGDTGPVAVIAPKVLLGTIDGLDIYAPGTARPSNYLGTFNYGGCTVYPFQCANMWVQLDEIANSEVASSSGLNGSGTNPVLLSELLPARLGHVWAASVNVPPPSFRPPPFTILFTSAAQFGPAPSPFGEVLIDPAQKLLAPRPGEAGYSFAIPADTTLIGFHFFVQAAVLPPALPAITLTNALNVRVGY